MNEILFLIVSHLGFFHWHSSQDPKISLKQSSSVIKDSKIPMNEILSLIVSHFGFFPSHSSQDP